MVRSNDTVRRFILSIRLIFVGATLFFGGAASWAATEQTFPVLQIGTQTYTNVTITSKTDRYIILMHSSGMTSLKTTNLPPDIRAKLGILTPQKAVHTNAAVAWANRTFSTIETPKVKDLNTKAKEWSIVWSSRLRTTSVSDLEIMARSNRRTVIIAGAALIFFHFFFCYCCKLICEKAGGKPGLMIWLPVLQTFPLLNAAGMSSAWFLALLLPVINIFPCVLWCFNIANARGKGFWTAFCLLLPVTNLFAFLYLAFSDGSGRKAEKHVEMMTLETA